MCTIKSMAEESWRWMEVMGRSAAMSTSTSSRSMTSRALLAWTVVIEPSWPVFMAWIMSRASPPRHSPTITRSGRMRRAFLTRSRIVYSPAPSMLGGFVSSVTTCSWCSRSSVVSSMVTMRSLKGMKLLSTLSIVVLPVPVPPLTRMLRRATTQARRNVAALRLMLPISMQVVHRQPLGGELPHREAGPLDGQRRNDGVHARAVGQPGVDQRLALVDPPAHLGHDPLDDRLGHLVGNEAAAAALDDAVALDVDLVAADDHDFRDRRGAEQVLQRPEAENDVLQVLLQRPQDHVLPQLVVQVRADEVENVVEAALHAMDLLAHVAAFGQVEPLAEEFQQSVQLGLALRHERGRQVELVGGQHGHVEDVVGRPSP